MEFPYRVIREGAYLVEKIEGQLIEGQLNDASP